MHHQRQRNHRHVCSRAHHRCLAELDEVFPGRHRAFHAHEFAMFEEEHRVVAIERRLEQPFGVMRRRGHHHSESGELRIHGIIAAGMMRGRRVADADAAPQQDRHLQPAAAHVLHLGDLVDDFARRIQHEIREHEIHDRPRPAHRGPASQPHKAALTNRRVAQALGSVNLKQPGGRGKIAAALTDAFTQHKDFWVFCEFLRQRFERGFHVRQHAIRLRGRGNGPRSGNRKHMLRGGFGGRHRTVLGKLVRFLHQRGDLLFDTGKLRRFREFVFQQMILQPSDGAACFPLVNFFARPVAEIAHPLGVGTRPIRLALDQRRTATAPRPPHRLLRGLLHGQHIVAVHCHSGQTISRPALGHVGIPGGVGKRDLRCELIVFTDEQHRQFPNARQVEALVKGAVVDRAITKKRHGNPIALQQFETVARAGRLQNARADDAAGAHHSNFGREQMHAAAPAPRTPRGPAIQLREELLRFQSLGQRVAVAAMRAENHVGFAQFGTDARGNRLLADIGMASPMNQPALMRFGEPLFTEPDQKHLPVKSDQIRFNGCK